MDRQLERCCGLVHKETIAACVRMGGRTGHAVQHVQTFRTTAGDLVLLRDWLAAHGVTHVAMESTGVYRKPVFYALEPEFTCRLVNAAHIKQVPGRKTEVQDCVWIAQLLEHGLLRGSFVPPAPIREVRDLTRYRKALIQDRPRVAKSAAQGAGRCGRQVGLGGERYPRRIRAGHAGGPSPGDDGPRRAGGVSAWPAPRQAAGASRRVDKAVSPPPRVRGGPAADSPGGLAL